MADASDYGGGFTNIVRAGGPVPAQVEEVQQVVRRALERAG